MPAIKLATTTSVRDTKLLDSLQTQFASFTNDAHTLDWAGLVVGSGAALNLARQGLADVTFTHSRLDEFIFWGQRYALDRKHLCWNGFVLVGPKTGGPITGTTLEDCFGQLLDNDEQPTPSVVFLSRGEVNASGTWVREQEIWAAIGRDIPCNIIIETNTSMMDTLERAWKNYNNAYTLTDIGTWYEFLSENDDGPLDDLEALTDPYTDPWAPNQYALMPVNPDACFLTPARSQNPQGAEIFVNWLTSDPSIINNYLL
ncbi:MAG: hypothetical protein LBQ00_06075 [Syntrophobacterales bacterium]|jgi:tungstate transport system substrate-binding protein|nr:hypothetical protein [Syntrophobacterales bacterium]